MKRATIFVLAWTFSRGLAAAAPAPAAPAAPAAPMTPAERLKDHLGRVFTQESVAVMERNKTDGYRFETFDAKSGYARIVGPFDGRVDFFRLPGNAGETLFVAEYACGAGCSQKVSAYRFGADGKPAHLAFKDLLSLPAFEDLHRRLLTLCLDAFGDFDTERESRSADTRALPACPFVLSLAKPGGRSFLYEVANDDGSGYALSVAKTTVKPKAALKWNGKVLTGSDAADAPSVFVNGDQMRTLF